MSALLEGEPEYLTRLVARQEKFAILTFALCSAWLAAAWVFFSIRRSHRIAGPAYKLTQFMKGITRANIGDRVALRKNDELQDVAQSLNAMLDRLESNAPEPRSEATASANEYAEKQPVG
jgi:nitrate/nitrite-specific signal transduction histidine kinase